MVSFRAKTDRYNIVVTGSQLRLRTFDGSIEMVAPNWEQAGDFYPQDWRG